MAVVPLRPPVPYLLATLYVPAALFLLANTCASFCALKAQSPTPLPTADGFHSAVGYAEPRSPFGVSGFAAGDLSGEFYLAVDNRLFRRDSKGIETLIRGLDSGRRFGFLIRPRGSNELLYSDFSASTLYRHNLATGTESSRPLPANSFDIALTSGGHLLVSANPDWPNPGSANGIWLLDPQLGSAHRELIRLDGPSGPIALDPRGGDLIYAEQSPTYPSPAGSIRLLRFPAAKLAATLAGGPRLSSADATLMFAGLNGAYDLEFDDRGGLWLSDAAHGGLRRILPDGRLDPVDPVPVSAAATTRLAFADGSAATLDPFQPDAGGTMRVLASDWILETAVHELRPARPTIGAATGSPAKRGTVTLQADGMPAGETIWFAGSVLPPVREHQAMTVVGVPVWTDFNLIVSPALGAAIADADGRAQLHLHNPGGFSATLSFAAFALTTPAPGHATVATTATLQLPVLP